MGLFAQFEDFEEENTEVKKPLNEKIFFGGDFGIQLGTYTFINLSPQIGYNVTNFFAVGVGSNFMYFRDGFQKFQSANYGGAVFTELYPFNFLVLHAETQLMNVADFDNSGNPFRVWNLALLAGGGYRQKFGENGAVNYLILWDFNQNEYSVYTNPIFRICFYF